MMCVRYAGSARGRLCRICERNERLVVDREITSAEGST